MSAKRTRQSALASMILLAALYTVPARAQTVTLNPVIIKVVKGKSVDTYQVPWMLNMSFLNAIEIALPPVPKTGAFSLSYFPQFGGYIITAVSGLPAPGGSGYWSTCLLPAGPGSTVVALPIAPNKVLVGPGDTASLIFNQPCSSSKPAH